MENIYVLKIHKKLFCLSRESLSVTHGSKEVTV